MNQRVWETTSVQAYSTMAPDITDWAYFEYSRVMAVAGGHLIVPVARAMTEQLAKVERDDTGKADSYNVIKNEWDLVLEAWNAPNGSYIAERSGLKLQPFGYLTNAFIPLEGIPEGGFLADLISQGHRIAVTSTNTPQNSNIPQEFWEKVITRESVKSNVEPGTDLPIARSEGNIVGHDLIGWAKYFYSRITDKLHLVILEKANLDRAFYRSAAILAGITSADISNPNTQNNLVSSIPLNLQDENYFALVLRTTFKEITTQEAT